MSHTIPEVTAEANELFTALAGDLTVNLDLPDLVLPTDFDLPVEAGNPAYAVLDPLTIQQLTMGTVDGTGVFDVIMQALNAQIEGQHKANRITGGDFAKVYLGALQSGVQQGLQFLLSKDQVLLANLQTQAQIQLAQAQKVRALADIQIARAQIQQMAYANYEMRFKAYTARNDYALSKMNLVAGYNAALTSEAQLGLISEQVDAARGQTKTTLVDGITPIGGIVAAEKLLKDNQVKLVSEQYESQRGQTRGTLSTGEDVIGVLGAQTKLYEQQVISYKRDAESKFIKSVLDTWVARKTIDEAVAVPVAIDTPAIETMVATYRGNLTL